MGFGEASEAMAWCGGGMSARQGDCRIKTSERSILTRDT